MMFLPEMPSSVKVLSGAVSFSATLVERVEPARQPLFRGQLCFVSLSTERHCQRFRPWMNARLCAPCLR